MNIEYYKSKSVLPMVIMNEVNQPVEVIICDSISGGANYQDEMPKRLSLTRILSDGTELGAEYIQLK